jgi:hypothetical protein
LQTVYNPAIDRSVLKKHGIAAILRKRNFPVKRKNGEMKKTQLPTG